MLDSQTAARFARGLFAAFGSMKRMPLPVICVVAIVALAITMPVGRVSMVLILFAAFGSGVGALFGAPSAYLLRLVPVMWRRWLYFVAVAMSLGPYVLHYLHSLNYLARSGVGTYSGLDQYISSVPLTMALAILGAMLVAWPRPAVAALLPVAFGGVYWYFLVPLLYRGTSFGFVGLDNVPFAWLFASSIASCVFLLLVSVLALGHRDPDRSQQSAVVRAEQAVVVDRQKTGSG